MAFYAFDYVSRSYPLPHSQAFVEYNRARLVEFAQETARKANESPLTVVALGNSRLKYALYDDPEMSELATASLRKPVHLIRIVENWATFDSFEPLSEEILALEPDVIFMQLDLLASSRGDAAKRGFLHQYITWNLFGSGPWNPGEVDLDGQQNGRPCYGIQGQMALLSRIRLADHWLAFETNSESARKAQRFARRAAAADIRVVWVSIPVTHLMEEHRASAPASYLHAAENQTKANGNVRLIRYNGPNSVDRYCDFVHHGALGRAEISRWLVQRLREIDGTSFAEDQDNPRALPTVYR